MQEHLSLHFHNEEASDESVLGIYPTTLRRRILRHLYGRYIQSNYLFAGARQKFLDAILAACRIELFMPHVAPPCRLPLPPALWHVDSHICLISPRKPKC